MLSGYSFLCALGHKVRNDSIQSSSSMGSVKCLSSPRANGNCPVFRSPLQLDVTVSYLLVGVYLA